jgi:hypothetical protein
MTGPATNGGTVPNTAWPVEPLGRLRFQELSVGFCHTCGLTAEGRVWCWGCWDGQRLDCSNVPLEVPGGKRFKHIASSFQTSCGLLESGEVACWSGSRAAPQTAVPAGRGYTSLVGGWWGRFCGVASGAVECWEGGGKPVPEAPGHRFQAFSAGWQQACGVGVADTAR